MNGKFFLNNLWRWKCNLKELKKDTTPKYNIKELRETQMSKRFIELMTNRMIQGTFRYGKWQDNKKTGISFDRVSSIYTRLQKFKETGNTELLVDIANLAMIEFEITDHPKAHFSSIDDGEHVNTKN